MSVAYKYRHFKSESICNQLIIIIIPQNCPIYHDPLEWLAYVKKMDLDSEDQCDPLM